MSPSATRSVTLPYHHTQPGYVAVVSVLLGLLGLAGALTGLFPMYGPGGALPMVGIVLLGSGVTFAALTVDVTGRSLTLRFGLGIPRRTVELREIRDALIVRNPWYYGWGMHLTPYGWIYNVSGTWAVQLELASGARLRVGTDEPARLLAAIERARAAWGGTRAVPGG